jgi:sulfotransferase
MDLHFISGLPRAGSTLFAGILNQNPDFFAGIISPLAHILGATIREMSPLREPSLLFPEPQKRNVLNGIVNGFYHGAQDHETIFDTNRSWTARMALVHEFFPNSTVFCLVRNYTEIANSFEWLYNRHPTNATSVYGYEVGWNVYDRVNSLIDQNGVIGYASNALREAVFGPFNRQICLIYYHALARDPFGVMDQVYARLGVPLYNHNFDDVRFSASEFDNKIGLPGLHTVRGPVTPSTKPTILPPDMVQRLQKESEWLGQGVPCRIIA